LSEGDVRLPKLFRQTFPQCWPGSGKQRSPNWLRDLLTKHVRLSADRRGRRPAAVTSIHSLARYTGAVPANELMDKGGWNPLVCGLAASAADVLLPLLYCCWRLFAGISRHSRYLRQTQRGIER